MMKVGGSDCEATSDPHWELEARPTSSAQAFPEELSSTVYTEKPGPGLKEDQ